MSAGLAPGVHVAVPLPTRGVPAVRMDVAGFVGVAAKGPLDRAVAIDGWPQFVATFGEFLPNAFLAYAVRGFFDNGGLRCHVVRVAAPTFETRTTGLQPADGAASIVEDPGGIRPGAVVTLSQESDTPATGLQPADRQLTIVGNASGFAVGDRAQLIQGESSFFATVRSVDTVAATIGWQAPLDAGLNLALSFSVYGRRTVTALAASVSGTTIGWVSPIDPRFDKARPIRLAAGAGAARGVLLDEAGLPLILVTASSPGQWGNALAVRITTTLAVETRTRLRPAPDAAGTLTLERVTKLTSGSMVTLMQAGVAPARRVLRAVDSTNRQVVLDAPLVGFDLAAAADGTKPITLRRVAFALSVSEAGRLVESFVDLDLPDVGKPEESPVNQSSRLIRIKRMPGTGYPFPDPASGVLRFGQLLLGEGRDGIATLGVADIAGGADQAERTGLRVFETVDEPAALAIPDLVIPPMPAVEHVLPVPPAPDPCDICAPPPLPVPPVVVPATVEAAASFAPDAVRLIQMALVEHCEARGDRVALLDPPLHRDGPDAHDLDALTAWRQQFDSSYAAAYFPWAAVVDPIAQAPRTTRDVPFSGHALGQFALADRADGHPAPANRQLSWIAGLPREIDEAEHAGLNAVGVNCVRIAPGRGIRIMGARTLSSDPDWQQLTVRRTIIRIKRVLGRALRWAVFEPNSRALYDLVVAQIEGFLEGEWHAQRLSGSSQDEAFYVRPAMTQDDLDNGRFVLEIGVAASVPAEFVILRLSRGEDRLDLAELSAAGGWPS